MQSKGDFHLLVIVIFAFQAIIHSYKFIKYYILKKHFIKYNAFEQCEWLVKEPGKDHYQCSNVFHAFGFKKRNYDCTKLKCFGFVPKDTDFDVKVKKGNIFSISDHILELVLIAISFIGLFTSLL